MTAQPSDDLAEFLGGFYFDPLGFVLAAFDWGHGDLKDEQGPDEWQADVLRTLGAALEKSEREGGPVRIAVRSGHGVGKTALISWIILFFMSTRPHLQAPTTANTKTQLETKTWRELALWWKRAINRDWFEWTATKFYAKEAPETWFASAIPWTKERSEAFAGTHAQHVLLLFDEASAIDDIIWEVAEGALTTPGATQIAFGNPTRNTGRFRECWRRFAERWLTYTVDSRKAKKTDKTYIGHLIEDYGEDSDYVRVRVLGEFPRQASSQFIPGDLVDEAMDRRMDAAEWEFAPKTLGVDVARFGDDETVLCRRQGNKVWPLQAYRGLDVMQVGKLVAQEIRAWKPDAVFVDAIGIGAGVVDYLRHTGHDVVEVIASARPADERTYLNLRAEMWGELKAAMPKLALPRDDRLFIDLTAPEYMFTAKLQIQLEKKDDMKKRGLDSPDRADALAMTFAGPSEVSAFYDAANDDETEVIEVGRSGTTGY